MPGTDLKRRGGIVNPWAGDRADGDTGPTQLEAAAKRGIRPAPPGVPTTKITTLGMFPYYYDNVGKRVSGAGWV